jgi:hypothetical protein
MVRFLGPSEAAPDTIRRAHANAATPSRSSGRGVRMDAHWSYGVTPSLG